MNINRYYAIMTLLTALLAPVGRRATLLAAPLLAPAWSQIVEDVGALYEGEARRLGKRLVLRLHETSSVQNAVAKQAPYPGIASGQMVVDVYGGLSEFPPAVVVMVICHELGHHLGGEPRMTRFFTKWSSQEGQADYWAAQSCLGRVISHYPEWFADEVAPLPERALNACDQIGDASKRLVCLQKATAVYQTALFLYAAKGGSDLEAFDQSAGAIKAAEYMHSPQGVVCRFDSFLAGSLCDHSLAACVSGAGARPACWY